ncbi:MAG: HEAT repeat domain-containing protein [Planctomycetota bacterium]
MRRSWFPDPPLFRALGALLLAGATAFAQGSDKKPSFHVPEAEAAPEEPANERAEGAIERTLQALRGWPAPSARQAAERLIVLKEKSLPSVINVLVSAAPEAEALKPGAAYVVGRIGSKEHVVTLLLVAAEKEQHHQASTFLEAAVRLDRELAVAEAFRFFRTSDTTLRHEATQFVLNHETAENLPAVLDLLDRRKSEQPFTREIGLRLLDRLVETKQVPWADVSDRFYRALGDESPQVAGRAMRLLAARKEPENVRALNELVTKDVSYWRQRSYAALALTLYSSAYREPALEAATIEALRGERGLGHPKETLARAAAALALAQAALRTNDKDLVRLLDKEIPIVLIDSVGARNQHYRDFGSVMPLAFSMLRRITGQTLPDNAPAWAQWWTDHGRLFRAKRELLDVEERDIPDVEVEAAAPESLGGRRVRFTVIGPQRPTFLRGAALALPTADMGRLVALLKRHGFFERPEADRNEVEADAAFVIVRVGDLDRAAAFGTGEGLTAKRDELVAEVRSLGQEFAWQRWWAMDSQPSWELFFLENQKWFGEHKDPTERAQRVRSMIAGSLKHLVSVEDRVEAARTAANLPGGGGAFTDAEVKLFMDAVAAERDANEFVAATVDLLVPAAGERATAPLIERISDMMGPDAARTLTRLCCALDDARVTTLAQDPRWKVRQAAVEAISDRAAEVSRPVLLARLADEELLVRMAAAEALARQKAPEALAVLLELATSETADVRGSAAHALGLLGGTEGRQAARGLLVSDVNPEVRVRAIDGLVEAAEPEGAAIIAEVFTKEADVRVRAAAANALVRLESPELVAKLAERLQETRGADPERVALVNVLARFRSDVPAPLLRAVVKGDDELSAEAAALGLARRWDDEALIPLIRMLKNGHNTRAAVRQLQLLTSQAFESESYAEQAKNYQGWATAHGTGNARLWFKDALEQRGYDVRPLAEWVAAASLAAPSDEIVPILLKALRDKEWFVQRNASFLLNLRIGPAAPDEIGYATAQGEAEEIIRAYHDWWDAYGKAQKAREKE